MRGGVGHVRRHRSVMPGAARYRCVNVQCPLWVGKERRIETNRDRAATALLTQEGPRTRTRGTSASAAHCAAVRGGSSWATCVAAGRAAGNQPTGRQVTRQLASGAETGGASGAARAARRQRGQRTAVQSSGCKATALRKPSSSVSLQGAPSASARRARCAAQRAGACVSEASRARGDSEAQGACSGGNARAPRALVGGASSPSLYLLGRGATRAVRRVASGTGAGADICAPGPPGRTATRPPLGLKTLAAAGLWTPRLTPAGHLASARCAKAMRTPRALARGLRCSAEAARHAKARGRGWQGFHKMQRPARPRRISAATPAAEPRRCAAVRKGAP